MAVTNLTGTKWQVKDSPTLSAIGQKSVNFTSNGDTFASLTINTNSIAYGATIVYQVQEEGKKCTTSNLGASDPSTVEFTKGVGFTTQGLGIEEITFNGDTFIKIPTMYRKVNSVSDNQITSFTIANSKIDNDYEPYSCFVDERGYILPYILIGKYWNTSANSCVSTTNSVSPARVTTAVGRTNARARGAGYQLFDWQMKKLWQDLMICLKENIDINAGTAWTYDELGIYWNTDAQSYGWIDGVIGSSGTWYFCMKPSKYASLTNITDTIPSDYVSVSYAQPTSSAMEIKALGYDANHSFFNFPSDVVSNSNYNTYYCDGYWYAADSHPIVARVGGAASYGAFMTVSNDAWTNTNGVRLCYRPKYMPTPKSSLQNYTWEEIKLLADALADNYISTSDLASTYNIALGDSKTATINGETHSYRIIGMNHDVDVYGNTIGMTFEQVDQMTSAYQMKSTMSSTDNWQNSDLASTLNAFSIDADLAAVITPAKKTCAKNVSGGTPTYSYTEPLWIESETEVQGTQTITIDNTVEGSRYEFYVNGGSAIKQRGGENKPWWTRSPMSYDPTGSYFVMTRSDGNANANKATTLYGLVPCFCI